MKKSYKKILWMLIVICCVFIAFAVKKSLDNKMHKIDKELSFVTDHLKIGTTFYGLDKQSFINYGYGTCTDFALLLQDQLASAGIASRVVGLITEHDGGHDLLEVRIGKKWVLIDPMNKVIYKHSFLEILFNPQLASVKVKENAQAPAPKLTIPDFFAHPLVVKTGIFYFSDSYRFMPLTNEKSESENQDYYCAEPSCEWSIPLPEALSHDEVFQHLPLVKLAVTSGVSVVFETANQTIDPRSVKELAWLIKPVGNVLKFKSVGQSENHTFRILPISSPIQDVNSLKIRAPVPSVLLFRDAALNFYGAKFTCNKQLKWEQDFLDTHAEFYNAFFVPGDKKRNSAWSPLVTDQGLKYRTSVLNLPGNEPRIRFQPYIIENKNALCELTIQYNSASSPSLFLYTEKNKKLMQLGVLSPCDKEVCQFTHRFSPKEIKYVT